MIKVESCQVADPAATSMAGVLPALPSCSTPQFESVGLYLKEARRIGIRKTGPYFEDLDLEIYNVGDSEMDRLRATYGWSIPTPDAIAAILEATAVQNHKIVEIGAGGGYWAQCLAESGASVNAFDVQPWKNYCVNRLFSLGDKGLEQAKQWYDVKQGGTEVAGKFPNHALFCSFPHDFEDALAAYISAGGKTFILVGEVDGGGGCGSDEMFELTEKYFAKPSLVSLPGLYDGNKTYVQIFQRNDRPYPSLEP